MEDYIGANLHDLELDNGFLNMTPKHKPQKESINKLDLIKLKSLCFKRHSQESGNTTPKMGENICKIYYIW